MSVSESLFERLRRHWESNSAKRLTRNANCIPSSGAWKLVSDSFSNIVYFFLFKKNSIVMLYDMFREENRYQHLLLLACLLLLVSLVM